MSNVIPIVNNNIIPYITGRLIPSLKDTNNVAGALSQRLTNSLDLYSTNSTIYSSPEFNNRRY